MWQSENLRRCQKGAKCKIVITTACKCQVNTREIGFQLKHLTIWQTHNLITYTFDKLRVWEFWLIDNYIYCGVDKSAASFEWTIFGYFTDEILRCCQVCLTDFKAKFTFKFSVLFTWTMFVLYLYSYVTTAPISLLALGLFFFHQRHVWHHVTNKIKLRMTQQGKKPLETETQPVRRREVEDLSGLLEFSITVVCYR